MAQLPITTISSTPLKAYRRRYEGSDTRPIVLVLPPHLSSHDIKEKKYLTWEQVTLVETFYLAGFNALTFAYKNQAGVSYPKAGATEASDLEDSKSAFAWLNNMHPAASQRWVAGAHYGAYMALQMQMRHTDVQGFVVASLPCNIYDYSFLSPWLSNGLVIHGSQNTVTTPKAARKFVEDKVSAKDAQISARTRTEYVEIEGAGDTFDSEKAQRAFIQSICKFLGTFHSSAPQAKL